MSAHFAWLVRLFPALRWWPLIDRATLRADLAAGAVGAIVVLPQGIAFATLAGLPPEFGLYAAMVPAVVAALWGSSRHLVSGPTNAISLVVFATMTQFAEPGSATYVSLVLTLTFLVGLVQLAAGVARLGVLVTFVSHTVVVGFTAGAALLIVANQLGNFFGIRLPAGGSFFDTLHAFAVHSDAIQPYAVLVGAITLAAGIATRRWLPRVPHMIAAIVAGSVAAYLLNRWPGAGHAEVRTLGALPAALPALTAPELSFDAVRDLAGAAIAVSVLGLVEAISIARSIALKSGQRIDGDQEFIGQGLSNLAGSFFSAYPSSGSFNRSGANHEAGAKTPLAAVFAAGLLVLIVLAVAPLFHITGLVLHVAVSLAARATLVLGGRFEAVAMVELAGRHRATFTVGAITAFIALAEAYDPAHHDLSSLTKVYSGGAPVPLTVTSVAASVPPPRLQKLRSSSGGEAAAAGGVDGVAGGSQNTPGRLRSSPSTSTGTDGPASVTCWPRSLTSARTRPHWAPQTTTSPTRSVPRWTRTVATGPRPRSRCASTTRPWASWSGLARRSSDASAVSTTASSRPSRFRPAFAETSTNIASPPYSSGTRPYSVSWPRTLVGSASGLSILLTETTIGTPAALAWLSASTVCGMTPSSAATTRIAISVAFAPRARMAVNAS